MSRTIKAGIVGLGKGGTSILKNLKGVERIQVVGAADINPEAPGVALARELGIFYSAGFRDILSIPGLNVLIEATGSPEVQQAIREAAPPTVTVMEAEAANLMMTLIEDRERLLHIKEIQEELSTILNSAQEGIQVADKNGLVKYVNPAFTEITGIPAEQRIGKSVYDVSPRGALAQVLRTGRMVRRWRNSVTGTDIEVISNAAPIMVDGKMEGAVVIFNDITELRRLTRELEQRTELIRHLHEELDRFTSTRYTFQDIIGCSPSLVALLSLAESAAESNSTVLLLGESGTGKEVLAQAIHHASQRRERPFVKINCAAIPENLLESELFGYEKGAFTGATRTKVGKFELAHEGTIFLDEIGDMSPYLQAKLLRVLQEREFERVGGNETIRADVRIIAATNRNLEKMVEEGTFRKDLYYRLNVLKLEIPPLRERKDDLPLLADHFIRQMNRKLGKLVRGVEPEAMEILRRYPWPGNVRELENFLERAVLLVGEGSITAWWVTAHLELPDVGEDRDDQVLSLKQTERLMIERAMKKYGWTVRGKRAAARALDISLSTLYLKLKAYDLEQPVT
ncbi:Fis family transcriptional regulator [Clostridiales bacterium PH28_bin88]|nr:Fis family transcriptional regulator [Clostridiales bacterium PH28_bin88]